MRKRLLAIIATAAMVIAMIPNMVFAGTTVTTVEQLKAAVAQGGEITLGKNLELNDENIIVQNNKEVKINLNGYNITGVSTKEETSNLIEIKSGSKLELVGNGHIKFNATKPDVNWDPEGFPGYANNTISNRGELIINGPTVENATGKGGASYVIDNYDGGTLIVESGKIIQSGGDVAIRMFAGSSTNANNVTINGGEISGNRAVWVHLAGDKANEAPDVNLTVTGGVLTSTDDTYDMSIYVYSYGNNCKNTDIEISGGTFDNLVFTASNQKDVGVENIEITGGKFKDTYSYNTWYGGNTVGSYISGGIFDGEATYADSYVDDAAALATVKTEDGKTVTAVGVDTIKEVIANAEKGTEITIDKAVAGTDFGNLPEDVKLINGTNENIKADGKTLSKGQDATGVAAPSPAKPQDSPNTGDNSMAPIAAAGLALAAMAAVAATRRRTN